MSEVKVLPRIGSEQATLRLMSVTGLNRAQLNHAWKASKKFASAEHRKKEWAFVWEKFCSLVGLRIPAGALSEPHRWPDGTAVADSAVKA